MHVHRLSNPTQWRKKLAKPGGAYLVNRKYMSVWEKLKSYEALLKSGGAAAP